MFDKFVPLDLDGDGDIGSVGTRGNSGPFDGVFWRDHVRSAEPLRAFAFQQARQQECPELPLPSTD